ncbi:MAG TPA: type IV secretion system protein, partial [Dongiaceae bacterium]|nr:type IV secretion system protein [Dongiaceae bacterium]
VVSSGIKVMVLAVIVGIGSSFFGEFITALRGQEPDIGQAMSLVLAALSLFGLGIFGPGIASGLVSGAPQLGAGAAIGTVGAAAGAAMLTGGTVLGGARALGAVGSGGMAAIRAGTAIGSAASTAYQLGEAMSGATGMGGVAAGLGGVARAGGNAVAQGARSAPSRTASSLSQSARTGREAAWHATGGNRVFGGSPASVAEGRPPVAADSAPQWARRLRAEQASRAYRHTTAQAIKDGDKPAGAANPDLKDRGD